MRCGSVGGAGGKGDVGIVGRFPASTGGGGISDAEFRGYKSVWTRACGLGFNFEGKDVLRMPLLFNPPAVAGNGGRWSGGDIPPPTRDGRRPGCDVERVRPIPKLVAVLAGRDDTIDLGTEPTDAVDSVGEDERRLGGAEVFRRWNIVP